VVSVGQLVDDGKLQDTPTATCKHHHHHGVYIWPQQLHPDLESINKQLINGDREMLQYLLDKNPDPIACVN